MAKNVLLLFSYDVYPITGNTPYREHAHILNTLQGADPEITFHYGALSELTFVFDGSSVSVHEPRSNQDLRNFDMVFFQKWFVLAQQAFAAAHYLQQHDVPFISSEVLSQNPVSKLGEMMLLVNAGVSYPKTTVGWIENIQKLLIDKVAPFSYPFILKDITGSNGDRNYLVETPAALAELGEQHHRETFMAQEYHPNDGDYRITVMGGEVGYVMRRTGQQGSHLNNTSRGGNGEFIELTDLPADLLELAISAAKAVNRQDFAGVDIISSGDNEYWVLEVNKSPEIQSGYGVDYKSKKLIEYFKRRLG